MIETKPSLFSIFSDNEGKIAELYTIYAAAFPEQKKMWKDLAIDEIKHAKILYDLHKRFGNDGKFYTIVTDGLQIINYVGDFINQSLVEARTKKLTNNQAVATAMRLELSMIEKKSFDVVFTEDETIKSALDKLNRETAIHFQRLKTRVKLTEMIDYE